MATPSPASPAPFPYGSRAGDRDRLIGMMPNSPALYDALHGPGHREAYTQVSSLPRAGREKVRELVKGTLGGAVPYMQVSDAGSGYRQADQAINLNPNDIQMAPVGVRVHEGLHALQSSADNLSLSKSIPAKLGRESGPSIAGVLAEYESRKRDGGGRLPSTATWDMPSGYKPSIEWMRQQAAKHGVFEGKSIDGLLADNPQWIAAISRESGGGGSGQEKKEIGGVAMVPGSYQPSQPNAAAGVVPRPANPFRAAPPPPARNTLGFLNSDALPPRTGEAMLAPVGGTQFGGAGVLRRADGSVTYLRSPMTQWEPRPAKPRPFVSPGEGGPTIPFASRGMGPAALPPPAAAGPNGADGVAGQAGAAVASPAAPVAAARIPVATAPAAGGVAASDPYGASPISNAFLRATGQALFGGKPYGAEANRRASAMMEKYARTAGPMALREALRAGQGMAAADQEQRGKMEMARVVKPGEVPESAKLRLKLMEAMLGNATGDERINILQEADRSLGGGAAGSAPQSFYDSMRTGVRFGLPEGIGARPPEEQLAAARTFLAQNPNLTPEQRRKAFAAAGIDEIALRGAALDEINPGFMGALGRGAGMLWDGEGGAYVRRERDRQNRLVAGDEANRPMRSAIGIPGFQTVSPASPAAAQSASPVLTPMSAPRRATNVTGLPSWLFGS